MDGATAPDSKSAAGKQRTGGQGGVDRPLLDAAVRSLDLLAATVGLLILSPLLVVAALAIRTESPGPVFFRQERVGRGFRPFDIYKFRTMVQNAQAREGPLTVGRDPRITRVGRILRKWKIDELPQLINVLKGDMSLVGPRPEVPKYVERFRDDYETILGIRPGITDPASITFRSESELLATYEDPEQAYVTRILPRKVELAKQYVRSRSLGRYFGLIGRTLWAVVFPPAASPAPARPDGRQDPGPDSGETRHVTRS